MTTAVRRHGIAAALFLSLLAASSLQAQQPIKIHLRVTQDDGPARKADAKFHLTAVDAVSIVLKDGVYYLNGNIGDRFAWKSTTDSHMHDYELSFNDCGNDCGGGYANPCEFTRAKFPAHWDARCGDATGMFFIRTNTSDGRWSYNAKPGAPAPKNPSPAFQFGTISPEPARGEWPYQWPDDFPWTGIPGIQRTTDAAMVRAAEGPQTPPPDVSCTEGNSATRVTAYDPQTYEFGNVDCHINEPHRTVTWNPNFQPAGTANPMAVYYGGKWYMAFTEEYNNPTPANRSYNIWSAGETWRVHWATSNDGQHWTLDSHYLFKGGWEGESATRQLLVRQLFVDRGYFYMLVNDRNDWITLLRAPVVPGSASGYGAWEIATGQGSRYVWQPVPADGTLDTKNIDPAPVMHHGITGGGAVIARVATSPSHPNDYRYIGISAGCGATCPPRLVLWSSPNLDTPFTREEDGIEFAGELPDGPNGFQLSLTSSDDGSGTEHLFGNEFDFWMNGPTNDVHVDTVHWFNAYRVTATLSGGMYSPRAKIRSYSGCGTGGCDLTLLPDGTVTAPASGSSTFTIVGPNGSALASGDTVSLLAPDGTFLSATAGGDVVGGIWNASASEMFRIAKVGGSGPIVLGDQVTLQCANGQYLASEGGGVVDCRGPFAGNGETFKLVAPAEPDENACAATLSQTSFEVPSSGGVVSIAVTQSRSDCPWSATSSSPFITIVTGQDYKGDATVSLSVAPNDGVKRTDTVMIAGQLVTITQNAPCTYSVTHSCNTFGHSGGSGTFDINTSSDCKWTIAPFELWARINGELSGQGPKTIQCTVDANLTAQPRWASFVVQGQIVTILQDGETYPAAPAFTVTPLSQTIVRGQNIVLNAAATGVILEQTWSQDGLPWFHGSYQQVLIPASDPHYPSGASSTYQNVIANCAGLDLGTATITVKVTPPPCDLPAINGPTDASAFDNGLGVPLSVDVLSHAGTLHYQWYRGVTGDRSNPLSNSDSAEINVSPPKDPLNPSRARGQYWVEVTDDCGTQLSRTATAIRVGPPARIRPTRHTFNNDAATDLVWRNYATGENMIWLMDGTQHTSTVTLPAESDTDWQMQGIGDLNGDGNPDLVWRNPKTGENRVWFMWGTQRIGVAAIESQSDPQESIGAVTDIDGDGKDDLIWRNDATGANTLWLMNGATRTQTVALEPAPDTNWKLQGAEDFNADLNPDLVFRNYLTGDNVVWLMKANSRIASTRLVARPQRIGTVAATSTAPMPGTALPPEPDTNWRIGELGDMSGDARPDLTMRNYATGEIKVQTLAGTFAGAVFSIDPLPDTNWRIQGVGASALPVVTPLTAPTSLAVTATSATYGGATTLMATLTANGTPVGGKNISFTIDAAGVASAVTDANGHAAVTTATGALNAGSHIAGASFAGDTTYGASTATAALDIARATPRLTWPPPAVIAYGTPLGAGELDASADVSGTFVYDPPAGTLLHAGAAQQLRVTFTPADGNYAAATAATTIDVLRGVQTIAWSTPSPIVYGTPLSAAQLNASVTGSAPSPDGALTYAPPAGTILDAGTQTLTVTAAATADYEAAAATVLLPVSKAKQTIAWATPSPIVYGRPLSAAQLNASVTSSGPSSAGALTYAPPAGTILDAGTQTLTVTAAATANYDAATASVSIDVAKAKPVLIWPAPSPIVYGTRLGAAQLNASADIAGTFVYDPPADALLDAGTQLLSAHFTPADARNYENAAATIALVVQRATPVITWAAPPPITYGAALDAAQLDATADVAGTFVYTPAAGTILEAGIGQTLSVRFTPADARNYTDATAATTIDVAKAKQTLSWTPPAAIVYGTPLSAMQLDAAVSVASPAPAGALVYAPAAGTVLDAGSRTLAVTALETANYLAATLSVTLTVHRAPLSLVVDAKSKLYGAAVPLLTGTLTGVVNGDRITPSYATTATEQSAAGTYPITAMLVDPNNRLSNYAPAITPAVLTVAPAPLLIAANPAAKQYSDPLPQFGATFTGFVLGETPPLLGGTLSLTTTAAPLSPPGTYPIDIGGLSSSNYAIAYARSTLTVMPEDARVVITSPLLVSGSSVTLAATINDISSTPDANGDTWPGDIRKATLTFVDRATDGVLCTAAIGLAGDGDPRIGVATCTFTAAVSLTVGANVGGHYLRDDAADNVTVTIVPPTSDSITGAGTAGGAKFTLDLQYGHDGTVKGGFSYSFSRVENGATHRYRLDALSVDSFAVARSAAGGLAAIAGTATLLDVTTPAAPVVLDEAAPLIVTATDAGEPSSNDALSVVLFKKGGGYWLATGWNGTRAVEQPLTEGNLAVHYGR